MPGCTCSEMIFWSETSECEVINVKQILGKQSSSKIQCDSDQSWDDCDIGCSSACLILLGLMRSRQNGQRWRAWWMEHLNQSQPNPGVRPAESRCTLWRINSEVILWRYFLTFQGLKILLLWNVFSRSYLYNNQIRTYFQIHELRAFLLFILYVILFKLH